MRPNDQPEELVTLAQLRAEVKQKALRGSVCPCCDQIVKIYPRTINATMARNLISMARKFGALPFRPIDNVANNSGGDFTKLRFWGLVEPVEDTDAYWRITQDGLRFARGDASVTRYAMVYNNKLMQHGGKQVTIRECLSNGGFDFDKLWSTDTLKDAGAGHGTNRQAEILGAPDGAADSRPAD